MPPQKNLPVFSVSHDRDGAAQTVAILSRAAEGWRTVGASASKWQVEAQNCKSRSREGIGYFYQQF
jgi:hypothetical protein